MSPIITHHQAFFFFGGARQCSSTSFHHQKLSLKVIYASTGTIPFDTVNIVLKLRSGAVNIHRQPPTLQCIDVLVSTKTVRLCGSIQMILVHLFQKRFQYFRAVTNLARVARRSLYIKQFFHSRLLDMR